MRHVRFSPYALAQLAEREISGQDVRAALENPDQILSGKHGRKIAHKLLTIGSAELLLRVIYEERAEEVTVVTVYATSKIRKYWRE
jgi:hypothetical protein